MKEKKILTNTWPFYIYLCCLFEVAKWKTFQQKTIKPKTLICTSEIVSGQSHKLKNVNHVQEKGKNNPNT